MKFKRIIYWISVIPPIFDALLKGVKGVYEEVMKYSDNRRYLEELAKFNNDNERKEK